MLFFCGDPHGGFDHIREAAIRYRNGTFIILGDLQAQQPLEIELGHIGNQIFWIHGNHDTDSLSDYDNLFESKMLERNIHCRSVLVDGYHVLGLGGIFRGQIWMPPEPPKFDAPINYLENCGRGNWWRGGLPRKHRSTIFPADVKKASTMTADILVTHEAPSAHQHGFTEIDRLAQSIGARLIVHGHHHENLDYSRNGSLLGMSVGYRCIRDITGKMIYDGETFAN